MARTVSEAALLLEAIAGDDWRDPQWVRGPVPVEWIYRDDDDVAGLRVGIVEESLDASLCEPSVIENVSTVSEILRSRGADVRDISVPVWPLGLPIIQTLLCHLVGAMVRSEGVGYGHLGLIDVDRLHAFALSRRQENRLLPQYMKVWMIVESILHDDYLNVTYGMLHNMRLRFRTTLDEAFDDFDLLITPTTPTTAPLLAAGESVISEVATRILESLPYNTAPLNLSGHPVVALPSGTDAEGLPTSVQVIARRFAEDVALRAARAIEDGLN
jgi:amidase